MLASEQEKHELPVVLPQWVREDNMQDILAQPDHQHRPMEENTLMQHVQEIRQHRL